MLSSAYAVHTVDIVYTVDTAETVFYCDVAEIAVGAEGAD